MTNLNRLLKNTHLRRSPHPSSSQRTFKYASLLRISGALHLGVFDHPEKNDFLNRLSRFKCQVFVIWILTFDIVSNSVVPPIPVLHGGRGEPLRSDPRKARARSSVGARALA